MSASHPSIDCDGGTGSQVIADPRDDPSPDALSPAGVGGIVGMVGGFRSEWWAPSRQNHGRHQIGKGGRPTSESAQVASSSLTSTEVSAAAGAPACRACGRRPAASPGWQDGRRSRRDRGAGARGRWRRNGRSGRCGRACRPGSRYAATSTGWIGSAAGSMACWRHHSAKWNQSGPWDRFVASDKALPSLAKCSPACAGRHASAWPFSSEPQLSLLQQRSVADRRYTKCPFVFTTKLGSTCIADRKGSCGHVHRAGC